MDADTRFSKAHGYIEFPLKQMAIDFLRTLAQTTGAQLFAKDKDNPNNPGAQVFIIAIAKAIYKRSVYALIAGTPASYYEWMGDGMKVLEADVAREPYIGFRPACEIQSLARQICPRNEPR